MEGLLNRRVLVLNQNYQPLTITKIKRAVNLILDQKVEILEQYNESIHSVDFVLHLPSVVRLNRYINYHPKMIPLTRKNLLRRDGYTCQYCNIKNVPMTLDHIIPKQRGGKDTWENLVAACTTCNHNKNNRTPKECNMPLKKKPKKPSMLTYFQQSVRKKQNSWKPYLFMDQLKN